MTTTDTAMTYLPHGVVFEAQSDSPKKTIWNRVVGLLNERPDPYDAAWDALFARSEHVLVAMAEEALEDFRSGRTERLDLDTL